MRKIILLGASGSIGRQTIDIIKKHRKTFDLVGFSVGNRVEAIDDILHEFKNVKYVVIKEKANMERKNIGIYGTSCCHASGTYQSSGN